MEMNWRIEKDSLGEVKVPEAALWGPQTQRAVLNFPIGGQTMPPALIRAFGLQKAAAARANARCGALDPERAEAIAVAALEVAAGQWADQFPLSVWQSGSGTQTNMNLNEVIATLARRASGLDIHPNDHVNRGQSTNDSFPTAMHIAFTVECRDRLCPALDHMADVLDRKAAAFADLVKIGRTHLMDATPLTLGQEMSGWAAQIKAAKGRLRLAVEEVHELAQGGTAVGTGLNAAPGFVDAFIGEINCLTGQPFRAASNHFALQAAHDAAVAVSGALNTLAVALTKIANDVRLMGSGPRCGLGELLLPANEPGSSIMPGKVNPTQAEALTMVCARVMGTHLAVTFGGAQGHLDLNTYKPLVAHGVLESIDLLADAVDSFTTRCLDGLEANAEHIQATMMHSLMLVTALAPRIGYDKAASIAKTAHAEGLTLKEAAMSLGLVSAEDFDAWTDPHDMIGSFLAE